MCRALLSDLSVVKLVPLGMVQKQTGFPAIQTESYGKAAGGGRVFKESGPPSGSE